MKVFKDKQVVLLQGPVGPFFKNLAFDLKQVGAAVYKINFNGGDKFFSPNNFVDFTGSIDDWGDFFSEFIEKYSIDAVILFGDCRKYHRIAHTIADNRGMEIGIFEEGYIRPDYITFEEFGVNGNSLIVRNATFYNDLNENEFTIPEPIQVRNTFWHMAMWASLYYFFSTLFYVRFRNYQHHRPLNPFEGFFWIRSIWRKQWYKIKESGIQHNLITLNSKKYYLVPLQISTDAQVRDHSDFNSVEQFIEQVIVSFSSNAPKESLLIIKHHPLDRGYNDYSRLIKRYAKLFNITSRVKYIHDQNLPMLLEHARGVVMINSTVGLSAIHHSAPLKVCGMAIYDFEGLTYQDSLDRFWVAAEMYESDRELYQRFKGYLVNHKQINGNFYRRFENSELKSGVLW